jgi:hypothetical protein
VRHTYTHRHVHAPNARGSSGELLMPGLEENLPAPGPPERQGHAAASCAFISVSHNTQYSNEREEDGCAVLQPRVDHANAFPHGTWRFGGTHAPAHTMTSPSAKLERRRHGPSLAAAHTATSNA